MDDRLIGAVARHDSLADLDPARRRLALRLLACRVVDEKDVAASVAEVSDAIDGYGPLSAVVNDDCVTDIAVNGPHDVWVERAGVFERSSAAFENRDALGAFIERLFATAGARIDASFPIADACMPDGTRIHAVLPPIAPDGPFLSIRRFPHARFTLNDLAARSMLTDEQATYLAAAVKDRRTLAISGGTGTGKTTLLNALLDLVGSSERVVLIEEIPELQRRGDNRASLVARPPNVEGVGAIDLLTLARAALRMRPDRLVVGRGAGAGGIRRIGRIGHRARGLDAYPSRALAGRRGRTHGHDGTPGGFGCVGGEPPAADDRRFRRHRPSRATRWAAPGPVYYGRLQPRVNDGLLRARAEALRALAALIRSGSPPQAALLEWHRHAPRALSGELRLVARRLRLGWKAPAALGEARCGFGGDAGSLSAVFAAHGSLGGDLPLMLDRLATVVDERAAGFAAASAAAAGARLSAQIVAGLPLFLLLLTPASGAAMLDGLGFVMTVGGVGLSAGAIVWVARLTPRPPDADDPVALAADVIAGIARGGAPLFVALDALGRHPPPGLEYPLERARRFVLLGATWSDALSGCGHPGLKVMSHALHRAERMGVPAAATLQEFARRRRSAQREHFNAVSKRAPVLMAMSLSFCALPSYVLLGLAPFLRGLSV